MVKVSEIISRLEGLKRSHYECEDCYFSCPKSGECCKHEEGDCDCGADEANEEIDSIISQLKELT